MINNVAFSQLNFSGKSFKFPKGGEFIDAECCSKTFVNRGLENDTVRFSTVNLKRKWGMCFAAPDAEPLPIYKGSLEKNAGLSTEKGGYGGGFLQAGLETPLSTTDVHSCVAAQFVDMGTKKHFLYHIMEAEQIADTVKFIKSKFPDFQKINIVTGDHIGTQNTTNNLLKALDIISPKAKKKFYHFPQENPEIVAHNGDLSYIPRVTSKGTTFKEVDQYYYGQTSS